MELISWQLITVVRAVKC